MTQILIAYRDLDMVDALKDTLKSRFREEGRAAPIFTLERNGKDALSDLAQSVPHLVLVDMNLPGERGQGPVHQGGIEFGKLARARRPGLPLIFIAASTTLELSAKVVALGEAALVLEGQRLETDLQEQVIQCVSRRPPQAQARIVTRAAAPRKSGRRVRYLIQIYLNANGHCMYEVNSVNDPGRHGSQIPFQVDPAELEELRIATALLPHSDNWARKYAELGERLFRMLLYGSAEIIRDLGRLDERTRLHDASVALCFVVDKRVYPIALEALRDAWGENRRFWLERAPLWRKLNVPTSQLALFQDPAAHRRPINCLIVEADSGGEVEGLGLKVPPLTGVREEAEWLVQHVRAQDKVRIGKIGRIRFRDGRVETSISSTGAEPRNEWPGSFSNALEDLLTNKGPWHLVHFAGHSHYDEDMGQGYLVLPRRHPSEDPVTLEAVGASRFANWLRQTQLVYLSSCRGSSQSFVYNMCEYNVAAVTGFRWNIQDETAVRHSRRFYEELFNRRSIEDALRATWHYMHDTYHADPVWISSELVIQPTM